MPPSINSDTLERNPSEDSLHSSPFQTMRKNHETQQGYSIGSMASNKGSPKYRPYGVDSDEEDNGCGEIALFERPSWSESLRRLKWCCPGVQPSMNALKSGKQSRLRSQSESTVSSKSSRQLSPTQVAPPYNSNWDMPPQMTYPPVPPQGWYAVPPGYPQSHYANPYQQAVNTYQHSPNAYQQVPNAYQQAQNTYQPAAWGYPQSPFPYGVPTPQHSGMICPPPPPMFHANKTHGYGHSPVTTPRKNIMPEPYQAPPQYDSGNESETSRKSTSSSRRQGGISTPKQNRRISKPPLVQRRATAPASSTSSLSPFPSTHKEMIEQPLAHPPLPPKQSSRKNIVGSRPRLPSEMSRNSVMSTGTASSRHRRQAHETFEFSTNSLTDIAREGPIPATTGPPPLHFIEVKDTPLPLQRQNSWSSWDDQTQNEDDNSLLLSPDEDEVAGYISPDNDEGASPTKGQQAANWMFQWAQEPAASETQQQPPASPCVSRTSRVSEPPVVPTKESTNGPVYLPLSHELDKHVQESGNTVVFSGWVAMSESDTMRNKLGMAEDDEVPIDHGDICYLQLVQHESKYTLQIHQQAGEMKEVTLTTSLQAQGQEISGRAGRCVLLQDAWTRQVLWTILPVSLPFYFFRQEGKLISERNFGLVQSAMFTPFYNATMGAPPQEWSQEYCAMRYAPDEQHDAAMHILFCLDAALSSV